MLDDFKTEQPIVYRILKNSVLQDKCSHAYLFETNGYSKGLDLAISFAKYLLCPNKYSNKEKCGNCNQCNLINNKNYLELKIIEADGQWIKKNQLIELQEMFNKKALIGNKKVYIINGADKLNASSSNSLLKFLEEPLENVIAILITENSKQLLDTVVSRCQLLSFKKSKVVQNNSNSINLIGAYLFNSNERLEEFLNDDKSLQDMNKIIEFVKYYEENKQDTILHINKLWNDNFSSREDIAQAFEILLLFYKDVLNYKLNKSIEYFIDNEKDISSISANNDVTMLTNKIKVILDLKQLIKYNINTGLLMDKLVIDLKGSEIYD